MIFTFVVYWLHFVVKRRSNSHEMFRKTMIEIKQYNLSQTYKEINFYCIKKDFVLSVSRGVKVDFVHLTFLKCCNCQQNILLLTKYFRENMSLYFYFLLQKTHRLLVIVASIPSCSRLKKKEIERWVHSFGLSPWKENII